MALIGDLTNDVVRKLANRVDSRSLAPFWIRDTIRELVDNYEFVELQDEGPVKILTIDERKYPVTSFISGNNPISRVIAFELYTDYPANTVSKTIFYKELAAIIPLTRISSMPSYWCRFGQNILFGNRPDSPYSVIAYTQIKHPFIDVDEKSLNNTPIQLPDSWLEIVTYGAAERGASELRMADYVSLYHQILFGDPENPGEVGLIKSRISQHEKDKLTGPAQIPMRVERY